MLDAESLRTIQNRYQQSSLLADSMDNSLDHWSPIFLKRAFSIRAEICYVNRKQIVLPGHVAVISGELEEELPNWEVRVGPREAVDLPAFMKQVLV